MLFTNSNFPLPMDRLPSSWNQEERMRSICAPFRNRSANPEEWIHKYQFWHELINNWSSYHGLCCFSFSVLNVNLQRSTKKISCLPMVWQELYRNGEIISKSDFLKEPNNTWLGWMIDITVKKSTAWAFSKLKSLIFEPKFDMTVKYVYLATVKELAELILSTVDNNKDNILLSISQLTKSCKEKSGNDRITEENIKLALVWLKRLKKAAFRDYKENEIHNLLVKISLKRIEELTEIDEGVYKLTQQENKLIQNIEELEIQRKEVMIKTKASLSSGLKEMAKTFLRKKQELDKCIDKRSAVLQNVQKLLSSIHDACYNTETLSAYKAGHCALKKFEDNGLTEEKTKDTMYDISEILEELNELRQVIVQPILTTESNSELETELELSKIMKIFEDNLINTTKNADDLSNTVKNEDPSIHFLDLPNLAELDLHALPNKNSTKPTQLTYIEI